MSQTSEHPDMERRLSGWKLILAIVLAITYAAVATYGVMSDTSARGLTVKMYTISRSCSTNSASSQKTLSYSISGSIWSSSSLPTSLSRLSFTLSVDGSVIGSLTRSDIMFGPGQSTAFTISFTNPTLNPTILPLGSRLVLDLTATVASGLYTSIQSASDSTEQLFGTTGC